MVLNSMIKMLYYSIENKTVVTMYNYLMKYLFYPVQLIISDNFSCYKLLGIILKKIKINKKED